MDSEWRVAGRSRGGEFSVLQFGMRCIARELIATRLDGCGERGRKRKGESLKCFPFRSASTLEVGLGFGGQTVAHPAPGLVIK